jgi:hypothetical protein
MAEITAAELETLKEVFAEFKSSGGTVKDFARGLSLAGCGRHGRPVRCTDAAA